MAERKFLSRAGRVLGAIALLMCALASGCSSSDGSDAVAAAQDTVAATGPCTEDAQSDACKTCQATAATTCKTTCTMQEQSHRTCLVDNSCYVDPGPCLLDLDSADCEACDAMAVPKCEAGACKGAYTTWSDCIVQAGCTNQKAGGGQWTEYDESCAEEKCPAEVKGLDDCFWTCPEYAPCVKAETNAMCVTEKCSTSDEALTSCLNACTTTMGCGG